MAKEPVPVPIARPVTLHSPNPVTVTIVVGGVIIVIACVLCPECWAVVIVDRAAAGI